jgi:hypothetical protein
MYNVTNTVETTEKTTTFRYEADTLEDITIATENFMRDGTDKFTFLSLTVKIEVIEVI